MVLSSAPDNDLNNPRQAVAECVQAVCEQGQSLDVALLEYGTTLSGSELSLFRALSYGSVRWYLAYRFYLNDRLKKPFKPKDRILYAILVSALYQLDETRQAPHAVVNEAVKLVRHFKRQWAAGLVNAVLRAYIRNPVKPPQHDPQAWIRSAYPEWMWQQFQQAWPEQQEKILAASQEAPPMTLRVNRHKTNVQACLESLAEHDIAATACTDSEYGITLTQPMAVEKLPGFASALVSVQDESAQLAVPLLDLQPGQEVLDACAAPGGKSLHILEAEPGISSLSVLDFPERMPRLRENFERADFSANIIEGDLLDSRLWVEGTQFDRILLDAPCTGTGVIRRHPDIKFRRHPENGLQFAGNQLKLLQQAWRLLKPGGKLLYTTCSILPDENELCVAVFLDQLKDGSAIPLPDKLGIKTAHGRQRLPGVQPGDGFFYALLEKLNHTQP